MIYSVLQNKNVPVTVTKSNSYLDDLVRYDVYSKSDEIQHVGYVELENTKNGVHVLYIKNEHTDLYRHFGHIADQIEVEHCFNRGIKNPYIYSAAAWGSHIKHFKRGKRFINEGINIYLDFLLKNPIFEDYVIAPHLGLQKMFMPVNLINKIKEKIKINPLLKP